MNSAPRILAFAGSTRQDSYNKKLVRIAAEGAQAAGAEVTLIDLRDFPMPIYDGDLERDSGAPDSVLKLRELMLAHQGLLIASPEYNGSISPLLKNAIDWTTRVVPGQTDGLAPYRGKVVVLMSASPGGLGGLRGLAHVRDILGNIQCIVLPEQLAVMKANEAFDTDGKLVNPKQHVAVEQLGRVLATTLCKLHAPLPADAPLERRQDMSRC